MSFKKFMELEQKENINSDECKKLIETFEPSKTKSSFSKEGFTSFLMFNETMELVAPDKKMKVMRENMKYPLPHYWIASSHNTYVELLVANIK